MAQASIDEDKGTVVRFSGARARASGPDAYNRPMQERSAEPEAASDAMAFDPDEVALRALISAVGARDESALTALYDATASRVMGLALRFTGEHEAAVGGREDSAVVAVSSTPSGRSRVAVAHPKGAQNDRFDPRPRRRTGPRDLSPDQR